MSRTNLGGIYNKIKTKERWDNVNRHNKEVIADYILELKSRGRSKGTITQYRADLEMFACYVQAELDNLEFYKLTKKHLRNYRLELQELSLSPARINRITCSLRTMWEFAIEDDDYSEFYTVNVAKSLKSIEKQPVRDIVFLERNEIDIIFEELIRTQEYQQALFLALLVDTAARKNEIYQIRKDAITQDGYLTNEVVGKRGKKFRLMYNDMTKTAYSLYIAQRGEDDKDFLWYNRDKLKRTNRLNAQMFYTWIKNWQKILLDKTGIDKNFNIHSFRHTALELLSTGEHYICEKTGGQKMSLEVLKNLAHHEDISITSSYLKDKSEDMLLEAFGIMEG